MPDPKQAATASSGNGEAGGLVNMGDPGDPAALPPIQPEGQQLYLSYPASKMGSYTVGVLEV